LSHVEEVQQEEEELQEANILNSQLLEQLVEVFKYYSTNQRVISMANNEISKYNMVNPKFTKTIV
jgi:hypothetical protein